MNPGKDQIQEILNRHLDRSCEVKHVSALSGGCIHNALKIAADCGDYFIKMNRTDDLDMFEKEFYGLQLLAEAGELEVPVPIAYGAGDGFAYLLVEFIDNQPRRSDFWEDFGRSLARLHLNHQHDRYGLSYHNYIGRLEQYNDYHDEWIAFFIDQRLEIQLKMAFDNGYMDKSDLERFSKLYTLLPDLLPTDPPSLLHGDLWSGNFMVGAEGQPVIIDPAVYYGHREIELSFTRMFGGFDTRFYRSYDETFPLVPGFEQRIDIYNIYPHLVHVNMFGAAYLSGVTGVVRRYV